jgi:hypothetical protein
MGRFNFFRIWISMQVGCRYKSEFRYSSVILIKVMISRELTYIETEQGISIWVGYFERTLMFEWQSDSVINGRSNWGWEWELREIHCGDLEGSVWQEVQSGGFWHGVIFWMHRITWVDREERIGTILSLASPFPLSKDRLFLCWERGGTDVNLTPGEFDSSESLTIRIIVAAAVVISAKSFGGATGQGRTYSPSFLKCPEDLKPDGSVGNDLSESSSHCSKYTQCRTRWKKTDMR